MGAVFFDLQQGGKLLARRSRQNMWKCKSPGGCRAQPRPSDSEITSGLAEIETQRPPLLKRLYSELVPNFLSCSI